MDAVLNHNTMTVHRRDGVGDRLKTPCGLTTHVDPDRLRPTTLENATVDADTRRCGRCFEGAGGY
ncbi:MAG: hypothetical protein U5J98_10265 [Halobacteriales archaeon]|nr:hypothetical protein [Halobacteriales archaeon]